MEDLTKQVVDAIAGALAPASHEQSRVISKASDLYDELLARGFVDAPRYKLSPLDLVPPKSLGLVRK